MVDDLTDLWSELRELKAEMRRSRTPIALENSSITDGRMRFIGGTLRIDSGGRVEIVGTLSVEGSTDFIGPVTISGTLDITGNTTITGDLSIEGATSVIGPLTIDGDTTVNGLLDVDGPWSLDGAGDITGNVDLEGDLNVTNGGRVIVGGLELSSLFDHPRVRLGQASIDGSDASDSLALHGGVSLYLDAAGPRFATLPTVFSNDVGLPAGAVHVSTAGVLHRVVDAP